MLKSPPTAAILWSLREGVVNSWMQVIEVSVPLHRGKERTKTLLRKHMVVTQTSTCCLMSSYLFCQQPHRHCLSLPHVTLQQTLKLVEYEFAHAHGYVVFKNESWTRIIFHFSGSSLVLGSIVTPPSFF